jgi:RNA polymerase sigma factor (sigma-70 family)
VLKLIPGQRRERNRAAKWPTCEADQLAPLVARAQRGEPAAMRTLLASLGSSMLQMARRVLGPSDPDVEDVFQESLIALVKALPSFRGECSTKHFACRIATLTALKARKRRPSAREVELPEADEPCWEGASPSDWALASCRRQILRRLLDELSNAQAEALVLHCVAGLTVEEIATTTQCPAETVRSRLRLAKATLRERIAADPSIFELLEDSL